MQHNPVSRAALLLAVLLAFGVSAGAEARPRSRPSATRKASPPPTAARASRVKARARHTVVGRKARPKSRTHAVSAARHRAGKSRRARSARRPAHRSPEKTLLHQDGSGEVVIDRVLVADAGGEIAGPSREMQNYPPAPCEPTDVVIEAHLHDVESDAAESDAAEGPGASELSEEADVASASTASGPRASLSRIARKVGSFFRPKSSESEVRPQDVDLTELVAKDFLIPVAGVDAERLRDSFLSSRGRHAKHLAIDIGAPKGTPILATTDGEITRITRERRGGKSIYQKDATGQYLLFYCHLSDYAEELAVGNTVRKGDVIGFVGSTGHVIGGSHLHFSITRLPNDDPNFRKGLAINPYLLFLAGVP